MNWRIAADLVLLLHLAFIIFAVAGGLLALRWRWAPLLHLPAAFWAVWIEWSGGFCPLTPMENHFRALAGQAGYDGGFIDQYLLPLIYPAGLTREVQLVLGAGALCINVLIYGWVFHTARAGPKSPKS